MKIDTDLRLAIKAAEKAQTKPDYWKQEAQKRKDITAALKKKPALYKKAMGCVRRIIHAEKLEAAASKTLCDELGLRLNDRVAKDFNFANCGDGQGRFEKAVAKLSFAKTTNWRADHVLARIAAATPKEGAKIIKELGINWT